MEAVLLCNSHILFYGRGRLVHFGRLSDIWVSGMDCSDGWYAYITRLAA